MRIFVETFAKHLFCSIADSGSNFNQPEAD